MLNNLFTYRDQRLTGWQFVTGLIRFQVICAIGAISNVGIATWIYDYDRNWWIAGLGGALIGTVWNLRGQRGLRLAATVDRDPLHTHLHQVGGELRRGHSRRSDGLWIHACACAGMSGEIDREFAPAFRLTCRPCPDVISPP